MEITVNPDTSVALSKCQVTSTSLIIEEGATFETWEAIGKSLRNIEGSIQWWVGDWCNQGKARHGEKYSQALEVTDRDKHTLENFSYVCQKIDSSRRREDLSFTHHCEVAGQSPKDQVRWLKIAHQENLSTRELRESIRCGKLVRITQINDDSGKNSGLPIVHGFVTGLQLWRKNVLDAGKIPWTPENIENLEDEVIKPLEEIVAYVRAKIERGI